MTEDNTPQPAAAQKTATSGGVRDSNSLLLSPAELAREFRLSIRTIRRLDLSGKLPRPIRVGRAVRWRRDEVVEWVAAGGPPRDEWDWGPC